MQFGNYGGILASFFCLLCIGWMSSRPPKKKEKNKDETCEHGSTKFTCPKCIEMEEFENGK